MKTLKEILYKTGLLEITGTTDIPINEVCFDSRKATQGAVFVATRGTHTDGHRFITEVIEKGCMAIVCEELPIKKEAGVTYVLVNDSGYALSIMAANFFDNPSEKIKLIGITGTNGKTTISTLLYQLFSNMGYGCGLLSTIKNHVKDLTISSTHTTPDALQLNSLLARMVNEGCNYCFMEVSSHAIAQKRISGLKYAGGIFTNITHDHLDYHKTFGEYLKAKKTFFDGLSEKAFALSNIDDKNGNVMLQNTQARKYTYSLKSMSDFKCKLIENHFSGLLLNIGGLEVSCRLVGSFNAYNLTAVYASAVLLGEDKIKILTQLSKLSPVEGRFDYITSKNKITGVVDYAHTPDALENVLKTIHDVSHSGRIITVVGCGGDRDSTKRPVMAKISCALSDKVIFTSDNPRSEVPSEIIKEMEKGVPVVDKRRTISIVERREAIKTAVSLAQPGDVVLVAGKGHEKYQEIKGIKTPFDDKAILQEMFQLFQ